MRGKVDAADAMAHHGNKKGKQKSKANGYLAIPTCLDIVFRTFSHINNGTRGRN